jgi:hypothetical protein
VGVGRLAGSSRFQEQLGLALGQYEEMSPRQAETMSRVLESLEAGGGGASLLVGPVIEIGGSPYQTMVRAIPTTYGLPHEAGDALHAERGMAFLDEPPEVATEIDFGWKNLDGGKKLLYKEPEGLTGLNVAAHVRQAMPELMHRAGLNPGDLLLATPYSDPLIKDDNTRAKIYMKYGMGPLDVNKMQMGRLDRDGGIVPELLNEPSASFVQNVLRRRRALV